MRFGDELAIVSTGTDQIFAYPVEGTEIGLHVPVWSPSGSVRPASPQLCHCRQRTVALRGVWPQDRRFLVYSTQTGSSGMSRQTKQMVDGLRQPHSAAWNDGQLYFCNSLEGTVNTLDGIVAYLYGYSRGLTFSGDGTIYTGTSLSRRPPCEIQDQTEGSYLAIPATKAPFMVSAL